MRAFFAAHAGEERKTDERFGIVAAVIVNVNRKKGARPIMPSDFFPSLAPRKSGRMSPADMKATILAAFGGRVRRRAPSRDAGSPGG